MTDFFFFYKIKAMPNFKTPFVVLCFCYSLFFSSELFAFAEFKALQASIYQGQEKESFEESYAKIMRLLSDQSPTIRKKASMLLYEAAVADLLFQFNTDRGYNCLLYTSPSPRDATLSRMPSSA